MLTGYMHLHRASPAVLLCAFLAGASVAAEEDRVPGKVILSDGHVLAGALRTTEGKPLRLLESGTNRRLDLTLPEIYRIRIAVESEEEYKVWRWVEDGSREKVYTGETYPKRSFATEVTLRTGATHRGTLVGVLYVYVEGAEKPKKVILKDKDQGDVGQKLTDLVWVEAVECGGPAPEASGAAAGIRLAVTPPEMLVTAHAIPRERTRSVEGTPAAEDGVALFAGLLPGLYDLVVVTEKAIYLPPLTAKEGTAALAGKDLEEVTARVREIPDFFTGQEVLAGARDGDHIRALVMATRTEPTSMEGPPRTFRRFELWILRRGGDRWLVDNRCYIYRDHAVELPPPPKIGWDAALGGIEVKSGMAEVSLRIPKEDR